MNSRVLVGVKGENGKRNRENDAELASVAALGRQHPSKIFACSKSAGRAFL